ncbi:Tetratricopeptide repeat protein 6 [Phytophthora citrophthora]|uniref:Tetratricopeptide repeat protein 6 n=1 Tax=Phytophthora citrophthora TaxID=4793 RepID=A0AAD9LQE4_9STRA|nr:Tetratricopeptide repeat protein 6 [Phytophthora citrophthora]
MDPELKRRPLLFDVRPALQRPPLGVITQEESEKLRIKHRRPHDDDYDDALSPKDEVDNIGSMLPAGALPAIFSPRPIKKPYIPAPSDTPKYFRWKYHSMIPKKPQSPFQQGKSFASPPVVLSPSAQRRQSNRKVPADVRAPELLGDNNATTNRGGTKSPSSDQLDMNASTVAPWIEDPEPTENPASPESNYFLFDGPAPRSELTTPVPTSVVPTTPTLPSILQDTPRLSTPIRPVTEITSIRPSSKPVVATAVRMQTPTDLQLSEISIEHQTSMSEAVPGTTASIRLQPLSPPAESDQPPHSAPLYDVSPPEEAQSFEAEPEPRKPGRVDDLATPIVIRKAGDTQPQVFSQHVLRGVILRKYLHVSNIARRLRETEKHVLRVNALTSSSGSFGKSPTAPASPAVLRPRKSSLECVIDSVTEEATGAGPIVGRLASVDKAISQTAHRMRLMSSASIPALTAQNLAKESSLRTIGEGKKFTEPVQVTTPRVKQKRQPSGIPELNEDEVGTIPVRAKVDPTSAHLLRICRHVIAKRAMMSFLRQEMSVITQTEVALRDDAALQRRPGSSRSDRPSSRAGDNRVPIKAMASDLVESLAAYLKEGDQHMTVDELFLKALLSEAEKDWKRAILLASACVVIDREFILAALLRARCCRRLGLWTQAIKDLTHAIQLRPEDQRLFLLRSCLHRKMGNADNALADVNRALVLHPQYTDALLLRAEIFHRGCSVGLALEDLTSVLALDRSCWRAYYDRATLRLRAIEGEEQSLVYHSEHLRYEELLAAIIQDYVSALHKGCTLVEVVETVGDLTVRLLEFTGDATVLRQVIQNLTRLLHLLVLDPSGGFSSRAPRTPSNTSGLGSAPGEYRSLSSVDRELLVAAIYAQRGRLYVLSNDKVNALEDFDHAVVMEYHYPVAHFYRGAFATLLLAKESKASTGIKDAETAAAHHASNMQHLSRCLSLDPTIAGAYTVRGALHLRDLRFNNALQDFKAAVATDPTLSEVWLQIALVYLKHYHDSEECIKACTSALSNDAGLFRAIYLRAEAYTRQGNTSAALRDYTRLTRAQPDDRWAYLLRGKLQLTLKMARAALYSFICFMDQVMKDPPGKTSKDASKPDGKGALLLCGRAYQLLSRFQSAVHAFEQAVAENPTSENLVLLSESLHSLGDTENSLRVSEKVVNADPSSFRGYVRRAQLLVSVGHFTQAVAEYDRAISLAPKEGRVYYERGVVQMQLYMRWRVACQLYFPSEIPDVQSSFAPKFTAREIERDLGVEAVKDESLVRKMMKQFFVGSITDLSRCIRLEPLLADAYVDRAELNALGEEYDRAFRDLEAATERQPKSSRAHVSLGVLKCQFAAYAAAIEDFDKAIKFETTATADTRAFAFFNRGVAYQKLELWPQAERSYNQSIALFGRGRDVAAHRNRSIVRCHLGTFDSALEDLEEVQQSAPDDDELHGALGFALLQLNRYEDAAKHFAAYGRLGRDTYVDSGNAYFNLATKSEAHLEKTQHQSYLAKARRFYLRAARLQPSNSDIRLNLANCLRKENVVHAAITQCNIISQAEPFDHASLECKALALFQLPGREEEAVACMDVAVRTCVSSSTNLENTFYAFTSGVIHRNALERKTIGCNGARRLSRPVTVTSPSDSNGPSSAAASLLAQMETPAQKVHLTGSHEQTLALYMLNRGIMLEKLGNFIRARQDYDDALHFDPLSVHVHVCLGTLSLREGRLVQSAAEFQRALELDPSSGVAHLNRGVVCLSRNELASALVHFDAAISLMPRCSYAYANKAVTLARNGDVAGAELHFKKAIDELPSRKEFYLARGKIVALQKRLHDAMVDFSTALFLGYDGKL